MKEHIKTLEKSKWQGESQPISCTVQNTGNKDAHKNDWVLSQIKGRSEGYAKWNKENYTGTNSEGKETWTQINGLEHKEEINIRPEQNEETRIQNTEEMLRNLWDNFKPANVKVIGVPEEEEEQEIENLFQK